MPQDGFHGSSPCFLPLYPPLDLIPDTVSPSRSFLARVTLMEHTTQRARVIYAHRASGAVRADFACCSPSCTRLCAHVQKILYRASARKTHGHPSVSQISISIPSLYRATMVRFLFFSFSLTPPLFSLVDAIRTWVSIELFSTAIDSYFWLQCSFRFEDTYKTTYGLRTFAYNCCNWERRT